MVTFWSRHGSGNHVGGKDLQELMLGILHILQNSPIHNAQYSLPHIHMGGVKELMYDNVFLNLGSVSG